MSAATGAPACTAAIAACSWYGPGRAVAQRPFHQPEPLVDLRTVPAAAVLVVEQHQLAAGARPHRHGEATLPAVPVG